MNKKDKAKIRLEIERVKLALTKVEKARNELDEVYSKLTDSRLALSHIWDELKEMAYN